MSSQLEQSVSKAEFTTKEAAAEAAKNSLEEAKIRHREELATRDSSLQTAREEMQRQMVRLNEDARTMVEREKERREAWTDDQNMQMGQNNSAPTILNRVVADVMDVVDIMGVFFNMVNVCLLFMFVSRGWYVDDLFVVLK
jgi:hypothetical protein